MPEHVSGWCEHGFEYHLQPFLLIYPEDELSLWRLVFCFRIWYGNFHPSLIGLLAWRFRLVPNQDVCIDACLSGDVIRGFWLYNIKVKALTETNMETRNKITQSYSASLVELWNTFFIPFPPMTCCFRICFMHVKVWQVESLQLRRVSKIRNRLLFK